MSYSGLFGQTWLGISEERALKSWSSCSYKPLSETRRYAPINPSDLYSARTGGTYGSDATQPPYVCGHNGVGVVAKVGVHFHTPLILQNAFTICLHKVK